MATMINDEEKMVLHHYYLQRRKEQLALARKMHKRKRYNLQAQFRLSAQQSLTKALKWNS